MNSTTSNADRRHAALRGFSRGHLWLGLAFSASWAGVCPLSLSAADTTVTNQVTNTVTTGAGDTLTVTNTGSIITSSHAVQNFSDNVTVINDGTISGSNAIRNQGTMTLINRGQILSPSLYAIDSNSILHLENTGGVIEASDRNTISLRSGSISNVGGIIRNIGGDNAIELREVLDGPINNTQGLITTNVVESDEGALLMYQEGEFSIFGGTVSNTAADNNAIAVIMEYYPSGEIRFDNISVISDGQEAGSGGGISFDFYETRDMYLSLSNSVVVRGRMINDGGDVDLRTAATILGDLHFTYGNVCAIDVLGGSITGNITTAGAPDTLIVRAGTINGNTSLGGGNDVFSYYGGSIHGDIHFGSGANAMHFYEDFSLTQLISLDAASSLDLSVHENAAVSIMRDLHLGNGSVLVHDLAQLSLLGGNLAAGATFSNVGTTRLGVGRILTAGAFDGSSSGDLVFDVSGHAGVLQTGRMVFSGSSANLSNQSVRANYIGGLLSSSSRSLIASGVAAATLPRDPSVTDNSLLYDFGLERDGVENSDVYLTMTQTTTPSSLATTPNNRAAAQSLESISGSDPTLNQVGANLGNASNQTEFNNVLASTLPQVDNSNQAAAAAMTGAMFELADGQLAMVNTAEQTGVASGNALRGMHVWTQGFGGVSDQFRRSQIDGYKSEVLGTAIGVDTRNDASDAVIGASFGYADADIRSKSVNQTATDVSSYQLMLYGNRTLNDESFINGMLVSGWNDNRQLRRNVGGIAGLNAGSSYDSWVGGVRGAIGRNWMFSVDQSCDSAPGGCEGLLVTPQLFYEYVHFDRGGYVENGAGGANLNVGGAKSDILNLGASVAFSSRIQMSDFQVLRPDLHLSYRYDVLDGHADTFASFVGGGTTFGVEALNPSNSTYGIGSALKVFDARGWDLTMNYDLWLRTDYTSHAGFVRLGYEY